MTPLQLREIFHIEFLRWLGRKIQPDQYALKGGVNLRLFFNSIRYSEDMDLDIFYGSVETLKKNVMGILTHVSFQNMLRPFGIEKVGLPDMSKAKQTETTQRFKIHLLTSSGEDLFTKIECSRRKSEGAAMVEAVPNEVLRSYKVAPLLVSHYEVNSAVAQKIGALAGRAVLQARDVFDLYLLSSQAKPVEANQNKLSRHALNQAKERISEISFGEYKSAVVSYLSFEDQAYYGKKEVWEEIELKAVSFLEELEAHSK
jgi:predicted nucleotidyltransferase component of viral defense system